MAPCSAGRPAPACGGAPWLRACAAGGVKAAAAWWSGLAAKPAPPFARRELACGGLDGEGDGGAGELDEAKPPGRS